MSSQRDDPIDQAFSCLQQIVCTVNSLDKSQWSEADTRLKLVDHIVFDVLGWSKTAAKVEERAGSGFTDYSLRKNSCTRLIVEAKKDSLSFGLTARHSGHAYNLNGPVFNPSAQDAIFQAITYSAFKSCELACVTNGSEWIIFRANRLGDGRDTLEGKGFVFSSLEQILAHFRTFFDLASEAAVTALSYRGAFQRAEGSPIRSLDFLKAYRSPASKHLIERGEFASDFDMIMSSFFERLKGDQDAEMVDKCFVVTAESNLADAKLLRIADDLVAKIRGLDTETGKALVDLIESAKLQQKNRFILLVGNKGAGKSTFIDRFFRHVLPSHIAVGIVLLRLDLGLNSGQADSVAQWLNKRLLEACEKEVFSGHNTDWNDCIGKIFFDEYQRWSTQTMFHLYNKDREQFKIEFGRHVETIRAQDPHEYIRRLLGFIIKSGKKVPCLVFDNTDHFTIQFQEAVFQYARSLYESEFCIVLLPITDKTSWQLSKHGALQSFESESLVLPLPDAKRVIERRIRFLMDKVADDDDARRKSYFLSRGIRLKLDDISGFVSSLNRIFIESPDTSQWISGLANSDIRRLLELTKDAIASPHLQLDHLLRAHMAGTTEVVPEYRIKRAIIKRRYDIYPTGEHSFVQNLYGLCLDPPTTPLLGVRILQFLRDSVNQMDRSSRDFVEIDSLHEYFTSLGIHPEVVNAWLTCLLQTGLILNYDPTIVQLDDNSRVELSPSGLTHLTWGTADADYIQIMLDVTPVRDRAVFDQIANAHSDFRSRWADAVCAFIGYLISEDSLWCRVPEHENFAGQTRLIKRLEWRARQLRQNQQ